MHQICIGFQCKCDAQGPAQRLQVRYGSHGCITTALFIAIVREWIKGAFNFRRPCTKEDFMLMALPCVAGMVLLSGVAYERSMFLCR